MDNIQIKLIKSGNRLPAKEIIFKIIHVFIILNDI